MDHSWTCHLNESEVLGRLVGDPQIGARQLAVRSIDGTVVLNGRVSSFFAKQMAQETIRDIDGIQMIDNRLVVDRFHEC